MAVRAQKHRQPSLILTLVLGLLTLLLGAGLGAISLVAQPVEPVTSLPPPEERSQGAVYWVKGSGAAGGQWRAKRAAIIGEASGRLRLSEGELNAWSRSRLQSALNRSSGLEAEEESGDAPGFGILEASAPQFTFVDGRLNMSAEVRFPLFSDSRRFVYQVVGDFGTSPGGQVRFVAEAGTLGRAPLLHLPLVGPLLHRQFTGLFASGEEWQELAGHWQAIAEIAVEDEALVITLQ